METSFAAFQVIFAIIFVVIVAIVIFVFLKSLKQWKTNNHSPKLAVPAKVVAKRTAISHYSSDMPVSMDTTYYVTFEVSSGDRMELLIPSTEYGLLLEGDVGELSFQGTRYLSFIRQYNTGEYVSVSPETDARYGSPEL